MILYKGVHSEMEPAIPKVLTPLAKRNSQKLQGVISKINQGLIGWGTLIFRFVNLHSESQKSTF